MRMYDIIEKKRNGGELSDEEIKFFISGATSGDIPDYQISALLMAIYFNGMTNGETVELTMAMRDSGDKLDLSRFSNLSVDKHSTGGVGDKTTLIVAPIVASLGAKVAKMSGRGLGFTGGTVDKLESASGYDTTPSMDRFFEISSNCGVSVISQTGNMAPADKKLYALRDVTATIESIPLITASIMSKKLAAGAKNIVLDVKCGNGAFMKTMDDAKALAKKMVEIGKLCDVNTVAVLTNMDTPLGNAVGNSLEVIEAAEVLKGKQKGALYEICVKLASLMVSLALEISEEDAKVKVIDVINSGKAFTKMKEWFCLQGANPEFLEDYSLFKAPKYSFTIKAESSGYVSNIDALNIGKAALILGAGREKAGDSIDYSAGVYLNKTLGDYVNTGDTICTLYTDKEDSFLGAKDICLEAFAFSDSQPQVKTLIYETIN